ncbi:MAG: FAD-dependent oxidoreductase [Azospirillaceae bacterium]
MMDLREYRREGEPAPQELKADICVVGSGAAGTSAALEAARLGRTVVLLEAAPTLGGQAVGSLVGTLCGFYSNGPRPYPVTYGLAGESVAAMEATGTQRWRPARNTVITIYDDQALQRWVEDAIHGQEAITPIAGAVVTAVRRDGRRIARLDAVTRFGPLSVTADGFVDATGDAALAWGAGLTVSEPAAPVYGSIMVALDGVDDDALGAVDRDEVLGRVMAVADAHGLVRRDGFAFAVPGRRQALINLTHVTTPLDAAGYTQSLLEGHAQADRVLAALKHAMPEFFGQATVRRYGGLGIRQTRSIKGARRIRVEEIRQGVRFPDAVARCSWPIELHHRQDGVHWEVFGDDHMHYVPLSSLLAAEADNLAAAGRCLDAEPAALASVRVIGPCIATGRAAATVLALAGRGSVHDVPATDVEAHLLENLERADPAPEPAMRALAEAGR